MPTRAQKERDDSFLLGEISGIVKALPKRLDDMELSRRADHLDTNTRIDRLENALNRDVKEVKEDLDAVRSRQNKMTGAASVVSSIFSAILTAFTYHYFNGAK